MHELGVFTKQTAGFFQALAANTTVQGNVILNGPRSGINFNDAAFGGNLISENLLGNLVRETVDHGPYNSWDRNPYVTRFNGGIPSPIPVMSSVRRNFLLCNYGGVKGIDHDDGSGYYDDEYNFMPYCSGKMKGETQILRQNVYLFPNWGTQCVYMMGGQLHGVPMIYQNNTCVARSANIYSSCSLDQTASVYSQNHYFVPGGGAASEGGHVAGFPCEGGDWQKWVKAGQDVGSSMSGVRPSTETMMSWGRELLQMSSSSSPAELVLLV